MRLAMGDSLKKQIIILSILGIAVAFQNCSKVAFKKQSGDGIENPQCTGSSCHPGPTPTPPPSGVQCFDKVVTQPGNQKKLDLLFVIDTSTSLNTERAGIAENIREFITQLPSDIDYNIAVLLAHAYDSHAGKLYKESSAAESRRVLKKGDFATVDALSIALKARVQNVPVEGNINGQPLSSGGEAGIYALNLLLTGNNLATAKSQDFFRADSGLAIVFLADEDDLCFPHVQHNPIDPNKDDNHNGIPDYEDQFKINYCSNISIGGTLSKIGAAVNNKPYLVSGIIHTRDDNIPNATSGEDGLSTGYIELIAAAQNRLPVDILDTNIPTALSQIGSAANQVIATLTREYRISEPIDVDPATIGVRVDGRLLQNSEYTFVNNIINFANSPGQANSRIDIHYCGEY